MSDVFYDEYPIIYQCKICEDSFENEDIKIYHTMNIYEMIKHQEDYHKIKLKPLEWKK